MTDKAVERLTPVPDDPAGENLPYRGAVDHGVPYREQESTDEAHYYEGRPVEYMEEEKDEQVIPVRIVGQGARELKQFRVSRQPVGENATPILGRDAQRTKVTIRNVSPDVPVFIGESMSVSSLVGFPIAPGAETSLTTTDPIYAAVSAGLIGDIAVLVEYTQVVK